MGKFLSRALKKLPDDGPKRILMLGLDNAGKTTILYRMKKAEDFHTVPTIGFNVETICPCPGLSLTVWDVGGQEHLRSLWSHYFENVDGLVFVVDSSDENRLTTARIELQAIYQHDLMSFVPLVILANKQDEESALSASEIAENLQLTRLPQVKYSVVPCCALSGDGLVRGFCNLAEMIRAERKSQGVKRF